MSCPFLPTVLHNKFTHILYWWSFYFKLEEIFLSDQSKPKTHSNRFVRGTRMPHSFLPTVLHMKFAHIKSAPTIMY